MERIGVVGLFPVDWRLCRSTGAPACALESKVTPAATLLPVERCHQKQSAPKNFSGRLEFPVSSFWFLVSSFQLPVSSIQVLVNIVLLPVQRGIGLDDHALFSPALQLFDQPRLARLQRLGNFRMDAQREAA